MTRSPGPGVEPLGYIADPVMRRKKLIERLDAKLGTLQSDL